MTPPPWITRAAAALVLLVGSLPAAEPRWGDPRGFFEQETVTETEVRPGLRRIAARGLREGRAIESQLLVVDLRRPDLRLEALTGRRILRAKSGQFVWRSTVSQMLADHDALGAINVAFFDIGATQATQGLVVRNGKLLREPQAGRPALLAYDDGRLALAEPTWSGRVHSGAQRRPLAGVNRPQLAADEVVAYQLPWSRSPGGSANFTRTQKVREILIGPVVFHPATATGEAARLAGPVIEIRDDGRPFELEENQLVLSAGESAAPFFRATRVGAEVAIDWSLQGLPPGHAAHTLRHAVAAQPLLIRDGKKLPGDGSFWTTRHPRSAVALHPDGKQAILLVVDGRSAKSAGMALATLADYLLHLGAHDALNLDGGGSSALALRSEGKVLILNTPSDGRERPIPTGLGVVEVK